MQLPDQHGRAEAHDPRHVQLRRDDRQPALPVVERRHGVAGQQVQMRQPLELARPFAFAADAAQERSLRAEEPDLRRPVVGHRDGPVAARDGVPDAVELVLRPGAGARQVQHGLLLRGPAVARLPPGGRRLDDDDAGAVPVHYGWSRVPGVAARAAQRHEKRAHRHSGPHDCRSHHASVCLDTRPRALRVCPQRVRQFVPERLPMCPAGHRAQAQSTGGGARPPRPCAGPRPPEGRDYSDPTTASTAATMSWSSPVPVYVTRPSASSTTM